MRVLRPACASILLAAMPAFAVPVASEPLRGTVYAADGQPAAGALVWAARSGSGPLDSHTAEADAKGRYALRLPAGNWYVRARRGAQGGESPAQQQTVEIIDGKAPGELKIHLEERGTLRGLLVEAETGRPIPGGRVFLDAGYVLTTTAEGRFEAGGLHRTRHEAFVVAKGRMRMRVLFDTTARADTELEVPVPRAGRIAGTVTDEGGKPIPGAYVGRHTSGSYFSISGLFEACDARGRFEYDDAVPADQPTGLSAAAPGYVEEERGGISTSPDGKPLELNFRLRPKPGAEPKGANDRRRIVSGVVLGPAGGPLPDVTVRWGYQPYVGAIQTRTDQAGRFRLAVPDEDRMLAVLSRVFLPEFPRVASGGDREVVVRLRAGAAVRARVADEAGKPLKGVHVWAIIPSPDPRLANTYGLSEKKALTDAEGRFEMTGLPENARFDLVRDGLTDARGLVLSLTGEETGITMHYGGAVKGRVVDRNGQPIRNFRVLVAFPAARKQGDKSGGFFAGYSGIGVRFTSADGTFVLTGLGAGSVHRITVLADGHGEAVEDRVSAVASNRLATTEAVTLRAGPPASLRITAVTAEGKPVAGARVTLVNGSPQLDQSFQWGYDDAGWQNMARGRTSAEGHAEFPSLSFSGATVLVQAPGYARHRVGWRGGQKELTATLRAEGVITGEIRDPAGGPAKTFYVNVSSGGDHLGATVGPEDRGRFRVTGLPAGSWTLTVRGSDGLTELHQGRVDLKAGETKEMVIEPQKK